MGSPGAGFPVVCLIPYTKDLWDCRFIELAAQIATWSKDPSTKVGAVLTDHHRRVLGTGYNGFPRGVPDNTHWYSDKEEKYPRVVHAEMNALLGNKTEGATLYTYPLPPCPDCAKHIIQADVSRVVIYDNRGKNAKWAESFERHSYPMLEQAGIEVKVCGLQ